MLPKQSNTANFFNNYFSSEDKGEFDNKYI